MVFGRVCVLFKRCDADEDDDEFALTVDAGLIERLLARSVDACVCCRPGAVGRGMKPKRVGARLLVVIDELTSRREKEILALFIPFGVPLADVDIV